MKLSVCFLAVFIVGGCAWVGIKEELDPERYVAWFNEHAKDYNHQKQLGGYKFTVGFQPREAVILAEFGDKSRIDKQYYSQRDSSLAGLLSCRFTLEPEDHSATLLEYQTSGPEEYGARLNYFLNEAQKDIYLLQGADTLKCRMYHFENTYGLQKKNTISLMFEEPSPDKGDIEFVFADRVLNVGTVIFTQEIKKLNNTPKLKLN